MRHTRYRLQSLNFVAFNKDAQAVTEPVYAAATLTVVKINEVALRTLESASKRGVNIPIDS